MILRSLVIDLPSVYSEGLSEMLPSRNSRAHSSDPDREGDTGGQVKAANYQAAIFTYSPILLIIMHTLDILINLMDKS